MSNKVSRSYNLTYLKRPMLLDAKVIASKNTGGPKP